MSVYRRLWLGNRVGVKPRVGALAVAVGLLAGCSLAGCSLTDDGGRDYNPAHQPNYALPGDGPTPNPTWPGSGTGLGLPGIGQAEPSEPDHVVRGGAVQAGRPAAFDLVSGSDVVRVSVGDLGADLFEISTAAESKVVPSVEVKDSTVVASLKGTGLSGPALVTVVLSGDVRWQVRLSGGASDEAVDLNGGPGGDVELSAGTSRAEIALPAASGTQLLTVGGGAGQVDVRLGGSAPVRVATKNGAGDVTIDGQTNQGVAGGSLFTAPGWDTATDRYDVDATSGVSSLTVIHG
jgi:hypothetical protein